MREISGAAVKILGVVGRWQSPVRSCGKRPGGGDIKCEKFSQTIETWDFQFGIKISLLFHYPATVKGKQILSNNPQTSIIPKKKSLYDYITISTIIIGVSLPPNGATRERSVFDCQGHPSAACHSWKWGHHVHEHQWHEAYDKHEARKKHTPNLQDTKSNLGAFSQAKLGHPTFLFVVQWKITRNGNGQKMPGRMDKSTYSSGRFLLGQ